MTVMAMLGVAVTAAMLAVTLRQTQPTFATALSLTVGVLLFAGAVTALWPILEQARDWLARVQEAVPFADILTKALGISLLTQLAADACRDAGETALASKAELVGKTMLLVCGMPLFSYAVTVLERVACGEAGGL